MIEIKTSIVGFSSISYAAKITRKFEYKNKKNRLKKNLKIINEINEDEVESVNESGNRVTVQTVYVITTSAKITAKDFLHINRAHWNIESGFFYLRDVSYKEDRQTLRSKNSALNIVMFRNFSIALKTKLEIDYLPNSFNFFEKNKDFMLRALQPKYRSS